MKLMLLTQKTFNTIVLPQKCAGQYWITDKDEAEKQVKILAVEGVRGNNAEDTGRWVLKSNSQYVIVNAHGQVIPKIEVQLNVMYTICSADHTQIYKLYAEPLSEDRKKYTAYEIIGENAILSIGRNAGCDIRYDNERMSKHHADLHISKGTFRLTDNKSLNGTYVNGQTISSAKLNTGDVIVLMGLQIVITRNYLFINNPDGLVTVNSSHLREYHNPLYVPRVLEDDENEAFTDEEDDFYYRAPRFKQDINMMEMKLDPPPTPHTKDSMPLLMSLGPSVTMGMASATTASYAVINAINNGNFANAIPTLAMGVGMLAGTLLWPSITKNYQRKDLEKKEAARQKAYTEYLVQMEDQICREISNQEQILRENDKNTASYLNRVNAQPLQLWERTPKHTDFLKLRLGVGRLPLNAKIQYPERRFSVEQDNLAEALYQCGEKERWLNDVPICLPLVDRFVSGIYAEQSCLLNYAKSLILQLVMLHSYDEVKLVVLYDAQKEEELSFLRWLPHTMDNDKRVRYIATNPEEVKNLSADLEQVIEHRKNLNADQMEDEAPYYVVLCLDRKLASRAEFLRTILDYKENIKFSVLAMYERLKDLPKECSAVIELNQSTGSLVLLNDVCDPPVVFQNDCPDTLDMRPVTELLANTHINMSDTKFQLPKKYTFLEMLGIGMVEHINLLENWSNNDPTKSLEAPIGIDRFGEPFVLDLHERAHGPHGLIAGMTGSGKSETIISYILSMAVNYHPNEVAFILIDYKGGGMAQAFENIPHTAGIITNLDGSAISRSLVSMQSELHRRERIFKNVSQQHNISNIDIYKYQKLYREGKVSEPLPHLVIISDEFAELKKDQPEFMAALTSTARVGRSLGVHLVLATQKPGGVVDDQIRSNSRFRLCLKVQDKADSTEMMGRPEASLLSDTGRFYLQVGNNELFELGQSAWAGAAYHPSPKVIRDRDDAVSIIDANGRVVMEINNDRFPNSKNARKQLDIVTEYIRQVSEEENIGTWKMWLPPIPDKIYVDELMQKYDAAADKPFVLAPVVGEYDDPANQAQGILRLPITQEGNTVVYGATGSGKAIFLEAMCYSLMRQHSPDEVNLYIMDFGAETMTAFASAPHVGDVILSHNKEKVENLFKLLMGKINYRKKLLADFGGSLELYNASAKKPEPNVVVVINNYANFSELFEERQAELNYLTREGIRYGIYFVVTCTGVNNIRFSMLQNFKNIYCLQMNNPSDYASVVGKLNGLQIGTSKGRGMFDSADGPVLEFQSALTTKEENPYAFYKAFCAELAEKYAGKTAANVPVLPEVVSRQFLSRYAVSGDLRRVPIGVEKETLEVSYHNYSTNPVHMVLSAGQEWKEFTDVLAKMLSGPMALETILLAPAGTGVSNAEKLQVCETRAACVDAIQTIFQQAVYRNNTYKEAINAGKNAEEFQPLFVIVQSMAQLKTLLSNYATKDVIASDDTPLNRLQVAMSKCTKEYNIFFILAESIQSLTPFTAETWYKTHVSGNDGIWIGGGINNQYRLNVQNKPQGTQANIAKNFGFHVKNTNAVLVKLLQEEEV